MATLEEGVQFRTLDQRLSPGSLEEHTVTEFLNCLSYKPEYTEEGFSGFRNLSMLGNPRQQSS